MNPAIEKSRRLVAAGEASGSNPASSARQLSWLRVELAYDIPAQLARRRLARPRWLISVSNSHP